MRTELVVGTLAAVLLGQVLLQGMTDSPVDKPDGQVAPPPPAAGDEHTLHYTFCELRFANVSCGTLTCTVLRAGTS